MNLKKNLGLAIGVGIVGAVWTAIADTLGIMAWPGFIGWTLYFYGGANTKAIKNGLPCMVLGVILAFLSSQIQIGPFADGILKYIPSFLLSFLMTYAQNIDFFSVAPATFLGSILYFSTGSFFYALLISSIGVVVLGLSSSFLANVFENLINGNGDSSLEKEA